MTTRAFRFQADIDPATGLFSNGAINDEALAEDPITQEIGGTGRLVGPFPIDAKTSPTLFAALNALAVKCDERLTAARSDYMAKVSVADELVSKDLP
jgi:hypothetical protein